MSTKKAKPISIFFILSAVFTLASYVLLRVSVGNYAVADAADGKIGAVIRKAVGYVSDLVPFSVFELVIALIPVFLASYIFLAVRAFKRGRKCRFLLHTLSVVGVVYALFILSMGIAYHKTPIENKMELNSDPKISAESLRETLEIIIPEINGLSEKVAFKNGESRIEYGMDELSKKLSVAYSSVSDEYSLFAKTESRAKPVFFSSIMSYFRITGIYTFYTGEANINMSYPDYNLPFTVAHEFAHRRGIMREDEANFVAFLVCISSDDDFIRYSGYLNMFEYLSTSLYKTDKDVWYSVAKTLNTQSMSDIEASNAVTRRYADTVVGNISSDVNDFYLKQNGTEGTVSYGLVTRLAVAYYKK